MNVLKKMIFSFSAITLICFSIIALLGPEKNFSINRSPANSNQSASEDFDLVHCLGSLKDSLIKEVKNLTSDKEKILEKLNQTDPILPIYNLANWQNINQSYYRYFLEAEKLSFQNQIINYQQNQQILAAIAPPHGGNWQMQTAAQTPSWMDQNFHGAQIGFSPFQTYLAPALSLFNESHYNYAIPESLGPSTPVIPTRLPTMQAYHFQNSPLEQGLMVPLRYQAL